jgi:hypothetical protein
VYDLSKLAGWWNDSILRKLQLGMFHCGVEVFGIEYSFQCFHPHHSASGINRCKPKKARKYVFREQVYMGRTTRTETEIAELTSKAKLGKVWRSDNYHLTRRNCLTFAEFFLKAIGAQNQVPQYVTNACKATKTSLPLRFLSEGYWGLTKWWESDDLSLHYCCGDPKSLEYRQEAQKALETIPMADRYAYTPDIRDGLDDAPEDPHNMHGSVTSRDGFMEEVEYDDLKLYDSLLSPYHDPTHKPPQRSS